MALIHKTSEARNPRHGPSSVNSTRKSAEYHLDNKERRRPPGRRRSSTLHTWEYGHTAKPPFHMRHSTPGIILGNATNQAPPLLRALDYGEQVLVAVYHVVAHVLV